MNMLVSIPSTCLSASRINNLSIHCKLKMINTSNRLLPSVYALQCLTGKCEICKQFFYHSVSFCNLLSAQFFGPNKGLRENSKRRFVKIKVHFYSDSLQLKVKLFTPNECHQMLGIHEMRSHTYDSLSFDSVTTG